MSSSTANRLRPAKPCIRPMLSRSSKLMAKLQKQKRDATHRAQRASAAKPFSSRMRRIRVSRSARIAPLRG
jgi:hypothetical protein